MKKMKKVLSAVLCLAMLAQNFPAMAVAAAGDGLCEHHSAHTTECGYAEAVEGKLCTHVCVEACPMADVTVCVHDHKALGCAHTPAVEGVACDHVHSEACGYVPAQEAVLCTCGAVAAHTAECASLVTEGTECDCGMPTVHGEGCEPKDAVAESCTHVHGECAYRAAVPESWGCGHVCSGDSGCITAKCAHAHDEVCGFVQEVKGADCTFVCEECKAEENHAHVYDGDAQYAQKDDSVHTVTRACTSCEEKPTETADEVHTYTEGVCVCGETEPQPEPEVLTITGWSWVDVQEIIDPEYMDAVIPGVGAENTIDWDALVELLPASITAVVDGEEVELPVTWECETFPEAATGGRYTLKAILPEGYALGEEVTALELEVALGTADQLDVTEYNWLYREPTTTTWTGSGTASDPYVIDTPQELADLAYLVNENVGSYNTAYYKLDADIDLSNGYDPNNNKEITWKPIGFYKSTQRVNRYFNGHFDGGNHTISNLTVYNASGYNALFGNVGFGASTSISNLTLSNVSVTRDKAGYGAAALVGQCESLTISNCTVASGTITSSGPYTTGGLVASTTGNTVLTITNCVNRATIKSTTTDSNGTGGFVGRGYDESTLTISGCTNYGSVTGYLNVGGIIGNAAACTVTRCANYGTISATGTVNNSNVAKAAGILTNGPTQTISINNCYNAGTITSDGMTKDGSIVSGGAAGIAAFDKLQAGTIKNCHNVGTVNGTSGYGYSIAIRANTIENCYYLNSTNINNSAATQKNADEFADGTVYKLLQAANTNQVWGQTIGSDSYPVFYNGSNIPEVKTAVEVTVTADPAAPYTYDGTAKTGYTGTPTSGAYTDDLEYVYTKVNGDDTTTTLTGAPTDAGSYTLVVKVPDSNADYKGESTPISFAIQPREIGIEWTNTELTYNDQAQIPTAAATGLVGEDSCTITVEGAQTDAGTGYTATATAVSNSNYKLPSDNTTATFAIKAAAIDSVTLAANSVEVTENAQTPVITSVMAGSLMLSTDDYTVSYKDSEGETVTEMKAVGTYTVVVTAKENSNYSGSKEVEWKITKKQPTITTNPTIGAISYGQTLADAAISGGVASVGGSFAFADTTIAPAVSDSNSTEYTLVFTPTDTATYDPVEIKVTVTVNPKEIGITWGTAEFTYDGTAKLPTASVTEGSTINSDQLGLTVALEETTEGAGTNAGTYTAKVTGITGEKAGNYKLPTTVTTSFKINNASQQAPSGLTGTAETVLNKADGIITGLTTAMEYSTEENGTYTAVVDENMTFAAGTYYVRYAAKTNYDASPAAEVTIAQGDALTITVPGEQAAYSLTADKTTAGWHDDVTITFVLKDGYSAGDDFAVKVNDTPVTLVDGKYTIQGLEANVTVTVTGIADTTAPGLTVTLVDNWNSFWDKLTFGRFFNETKTFTISAEDKESGLKTVHYYLADKELTLNEVKALTSEKWTAYDLNGSGVSVDPDKVFVIYAKAEDNAGNITYVNSDGIVLDKTVPVIAGVTNGGVYYTTQKVTATDAYLTTQTLNGTDFDGTIPGDPAAETKYTVAAADKAGNSTTLEITMKPIASLAEGLPTEETVKLTDKETIETIKKNVSDVLTNQSANATQTEKDKLNAILDQCNTLLNRIQQAENVIALIDAMPDASKVEPNDKSAIDAYNAAEAAYNASDLPASSKRMVGDENKAKLDAMLKALTAYDIIKQSATYYVKGSYKALSFTVNGYIDLFTSIAVDGKTVDAKYYEVSSDKDNNTVIKLKTSYLENLDTGKHTIQVFYTLNGTVYSTDGKDTFRISVNNGNPFTGDDTHMMLFGGIMMTSILCMVMMVMFVPRKKGKYER